MKRAALLLTLVLVSIIGCNSDPAEPTGQTPATSTGTDANATLVKLTVPGMT